MNFLKFKVANKGLLVRWYVRQTLARTVLINGNTTVLIQ